MVIRILREDERERPLDLVVEGEGVEAGRAVGGLRRRRHPLPRVVLITRSSWLVRLYGARSQPKASLKASATAAWRSVAEGGGGGEVVEVEAEVEVVVEVEVEEEVVVAAAPHTWRSESSSFDCSRPFAI